jgi:hypothetical protein
MVLTTSTRAEKPALRGEKRDRAVERFAGWY